MPNTSRLHEDGELDVLTRRSNGTPTGLSNHANGRASCDPHRRHADGRAFVLRPTNGLVRTHVIRFVPPCRPEEVSKRHYHDVEFQMIYVLKGWISPVNEYFSVLVQELSLSNSHRQICIATLSQ